MLVMAHFWQSNWALGMSCFNCIDSLSDQIAQSGQCAQTGRSDAHQRESSVYQKGHATGPYKNNQRGSRLGSLYYDNITTLTTCPRRSRGCD